MDILNAYYGGGGEVGLGPILYISYKLNFLINLLILYYINK